ncbi:MAG: hypothetical protein DHS20C15_19160 [Planctomycetota bacterium]|nr:MAG: hypothetical protein DHS20C15_19160 [Planctomycetota bacterium]
MPRTLTLFALAVASLLGAGPVAAHSPHDDVHVVAVSPTFAQDSTIFAQMNMSEHRVFARSTDAGRSWQTFGHEMVQSKVLEIRMSPDFVNDGTAFLGTEGAGLWRSSDYGTTWQRVLDGLDALVVNTVRFDPDYSSSGIVGLSSDLGFYRSTDHGLSWTQKNTGLTELSLGTLAVHRGTNGRPVFYAGSTKLHRSDTLGATWTPLADFGGVATDLRLHPDFPVLPVIGVVLRSALGLRFSVDGGLSFPPEQASLQGSAVTDLLMREDGSMFASLFNGVVRADSLGATWVPQPKTGLDGLSDQTTIHYVQLQSAKLPDDGGEMLLLSGFEGLFRSTNDGQSWNSVDLYSQRVNRTITISPDFPRDRVLALGNFGGGLVISESAGKHWEAVGSGGVLGSGGAAVGSGAGSRSATQGAPGGHLSAPTTPANGAINWRTNATDIFSLWMGPIAISPTFAVDNTLMIGHGALWVSEDRGRNWFAPELAPEITVVRGITMSPDFQHDGVAFFGTSDFGQGAQNKGVWKTVDHGQSWQLANANLSITAQVREFVFSPGWSVDQTVFMAARNEGVWISEDGGASWSPRSNGLTHPELRVIRLSPDFVNDHTLWVGSVGGGLFMSVDAGASWEAVNHGIPDLAGIDVEGIAVSPAFAVDHTLFVSTQRSGLWKSIDAARTWQPVNDGLPLDMPRGLEISSGFAEDQTLFLSTHDWIWTSTDGGDHWSRLSGRIRVADNHPSVLYDTKWLRGLQPGAHGFSSSTSLDEVTACELEFRGNQIRWFADLSPEGGLARVLVDGEEIATLDTYAAELAPQTQLFEHNFGATDWHTIRIETTGQANPQSSGARLVSDGFEYRF